MVSMHCDRAGRRRRSKVAVIGAGPIGLMCLFAAKTLHQSSVVISDRLPERLAAGQLLGADRTVNPPHESLESECQKLWGGERPEYVIDAVGSAQTKQLALDLVEPGGTVVWVGLHENTIQLQSYAVTLRQKCVAGSYSGSLVDLRQAAQILAEGKLETSWGFDARWKKAKPRSWICCGPIQARSRWSCDTKEGL